MPFSDAAMDTAAIAIQAKYRYAQLNAAAAGADGTASPTTAPRQPVPWSAPTGSGNFLSTPIDFTGGAPNGPVYSVTLWSALSGGSFGGEFELTGDTSFNASGDYTVTDISLTGSAT